MEVDLTQIMVTLVTLVSAVMTGILFPLIRSKVSAAQWELIKEFAVAGGSIRGGRFFVSEYINHWLVLLD